MNLSEPPSPFAHRILVIADRKRLGELVQSRYPGIAVASVPSFMSGIAELASGPVHAVLAYIDPAFGPVECAVRGLREALGEDVPVVLCCDPEAEPLTRQVVPAGASSYLIYPPEPQELDESLSLVAPASFPAQTPPGTSEQEMLQLSRALEAMTDKPQRVLEGLAELLLSALPATAATVAAEGIKAAAGHQPFEAVLTEPITRGSSQVGEIALGQASTGAYSSAQLDKLRYYAGLFGHVIHAAKKQHELQHLAMTDDLTRLPNRRYLSQFLGELLHRAARERTRVTICLFDIDDFKTYNDEFGHAAGDEILRASARLFAKHCRPEDVVARYGGDEFVVVFWDAESPRVVGSQHPSDALVVMHRFQQALKEHDFAGLGPKAKGVLTISGGLATYPWDAGTPDELLRRADEALLEAKHHGKSQIHLVGGPAE